MINFTETQKSIIRILFVEKESSRSLLAKKLSLTNAALTLSMKPLLESKIVIESKIDQQRVGRKELKLKLNPNYGYFLGVDIRIHHVYFSLMDIAGNLIDFKCDKDISFHDFYSNVSGKILAIGVTNRGPISKEAIAQRFPELSKEIDGLDLPKYLFNNVDCLGNIYSLNHPDDKNFLLVKYGPGVGSSIYVFGKQLTTLSELGHIFYKDKRLEEVISYSAVLGREVEEAEANELIYNDKEKIDYILHVIAFGLLNADALLSLQKIILSGYILSKESSKEKLNEEIKKLDKNFDISKLTLYPDYDETNKKKSSIGAFIKYFE